MISKVPKLIGVVEIAIDRVVNTVRQAASVIVKPST